MMLSRSLKSTLPALVLAFTASHAMAGKYDLKATFKYENRHFRALNDSTKSCLNEREQFMERYLDFIGTLDQEQERSKMSRGENAFVVTSQPIFPEIPGKIFSKNSSFYERVFSFLHYDIEGVLYRVQQLENEVIQYGKQHNVSKEESLEAVLRAFESKIGFRRLVIEKDCAKTTRFMSDDVFNAGMEAWEHPELYSDEVRKGVCGVLSPQQFYEIIHRGFAFVDVGASEQHGVHSHRIHWYLIGEEFLEYPGDFLNAKDLAEIKTPAQKYETVLNMYKMLGDEDLKQATDWTRTGIADYLEDRDSSVVGPIKRNKNGRDIYGTPFLTNDYRRLELPDLWFHLLDTFRYADATNASFFGFSQGIGCFQELPRMGNPPATAPYYLIRDFSLSL